MIAASYDIIAITETWLSQDVLSSEYFNSDYNVYRSNGKGRGRRILLAVKSSFTSKTLPLTSPISEVGTIGTQILVAFLSTTK